MPDELSDKPVISELLTQTRSVAMGLNLPAAILFACRYNSIRSPMAAAIVRRMFPNRIYCRSAGINPGSADPFTNQVMAEIGIDISRHVPHTFASLYDSSFDLVICLSREAYKEARQLAQTMAFEVEYWPVISPQKDLGNREQIVDSYRLVRDDLLLRIRERFVTNIASDF